MGNDEIRQALGQIAEKVADVAASVKVIENRLASGDKKFDGLPCSGHMERMAELEQKLAVMTSRLDTVQTIVYGAVGIALVAVGGAIVALVVK